MKLSAHRIGFRLEVAIRFGRRDFLFGRPAGPPPQRSQKGH